MTSLLTYSQWDALNPRIEPFRWPFRHLVHCVRQAGAAIWQISGRAAAHARPRFPDWTASTNQFKNKT